MLAHALEYYISSINQTLLLDDINALFDYGNSWQLFFNNTKCTHLHFHFNPSTHTPTYYINNNYGNAQKN